MLSRIPPVKHGISSDAGRGAVVLEITHDDMLYIFQLARLRPFKPGILCRDMFKICNLRNPADAVALGQILGVKKSLQVKIIDHTSFYI